MTTKAETRTPVVDQVFGANKAPMLDVLSADFADLRAKIDELTDRLRDAAQKPVKTDEDQAALGSLILDARALLKDADEIRAAEKKPILDAGRDMDGWFRDITAALGRGRDHLQGMADRYASEKAAAERARRQREAEEARRKQAEESAKAEAAKTAAGAGRAEGRAERYGAQADAAESAAAASAADLTRTRAGGVTASARGRWIAEILDYQAAIAPLGAVGPFLKQDALLSALNSMASIQKESASWPGVRFKQDVKASFRK